MDTNPCWASAKRAGFRFAFSYLILFILPFPINFLPFSSSIVDAYNSIWDAVVPSAGRHILRLGYDVTLPDGGSGDTAWNYIQILCFILVAVLVSAIWPLLDKRAAGYDQLAKWLRVSVRLFLASAIIGYGVVKVIPVQMPEPSLSTLLRSYGDSSPMALLWTFMGASKGYQTFTGAAEILAGVLLAFPATARLGALLSIADMTQVFALNMAYDVPVKLYSLHLLILGVFLIAPDLKRIFQATLSDRNVPAVTRPPLFSRPGFNTGALWLQGLFCIYLLASGLYGSYQRARSWGFLAPKPPLYGIWPVEEFAIDGQIRPPLLTDEARWQRVVFDFPGSIEMQLVGGDRQRYSLSIDSENKTITLGKRQAPDWSAKFSVEEAAGNRMILDGALDGHRIHATLAHDDSTFALTSRGFHWITEVPAYP
jgi:uncharacterized membrane protein YphA (DoxX/SURF4 family)